MRFRSRQELEEHQLERLLTLLDRLAPGNAFYARRLRAAGLDRGVGSLAEFRRRMPFTTKPELVEDQRRHPPYGSNLTFSLGRYVRLHQTSGTTGAPLRWLDTADDWQWMVEAWRQVLEGAGVAAADRVNFAFSFGPFLGFWVGFDAATRMGCLALPGGGLGSAARLEMIAANRATVLCCTPTYAIRLGETALDARIDLSESRVAKIIVAGEPGGSLPAVRARIEALWPGARVFDHYGMTEVGPVTCQTGVTDGYVHVIESHYLCEIIDPDSARPLTPELEQTGELVLTTLGRTGSPLLRYRTGDLVRPTTPLPQDPDPVTTKLAGGILGRRDDMIIVRGVNLYPSAVDQLVREVGGVAEYRVEIRDVRGLTELRLEIEPASREVDAQGLQRRLEEAFRRNYSLRVPVTVAAPGSLPRFELKAKRWIRR